MEPRTGRRHRTRWARAALAAAVSAVSVVAASWGGTCASTAEGLPAWTGCTTGPRLGAVAVFVLLVDISFCAYAVSRARRRRWTVTPDGPGAA